MEEENNESTQSSMSSGKVWKDGVSLSMSVGGFSMSSIDEIEALTDDNLDNLSDFVEDDEVYESGIPGEDELLDEEILLSYDQTEGEEKENDEGEYTSDLGAYDEIPAETTFWDHDKKSINLEAYHSYHIPAGRALSSHSESFSSIDPAKQEKINKKKHIDLEKIEKSPRKWNEEFQELIDSYRNVMSKKKNEDNKYKKAEEIIQKLIILHQEFLQVSENIVQILVEQMILDPEERTIHKAEVPGLAGGDKYIVNNIFFKFATNSHAIFDNELQAQKCASHEIKGLMSCVSVLLNVGIHFPLSAMFRYKGRCVTAVATLPIDNSTLVYGSSDAGSTVYKSDKQMNLMMRHLGKTLLLKEHQVGFKKQVSIVGPVDIEGHKGKDGRYYIVDTARLFPPEAPHDERRKGDFLTRLLRPESIRRFGKPLSSDSFSAMGRYNKEEHNKEVEEATHFLHEKLIPQCAVSLEEKFKNYSYSELPDLEFYIHRNGVNLRHLGKVRSHVSSKALRKALLTQAVGRTIVEQIYRALIKFDSTVDEDESPFMKKLNEILTSDEYWNNELKKLVVRKFPDCLRKEEMDSSFQLKRAVEMEAIYYLIEQKVGSKINEKPGAPIKRENLKFYVTVKYPPFLAIEEGRLAFHSAIEETPGSERFREFLLQSIEKFKFALNLNSEDHRPYFNLGLSYLWMINTFQDDENIQQCYHAAFFNLKECLMLSDSEKIIKSWLDVMCVQLKRELNPQRKEAILEYIREQNELSQDKKNWKVIQPKLEKLLKK